MESKNKVKIHKKQKTAKAPKLQDQTLDDFLRKLV